MAKMIMIFNPECADKVFIDNLQNCVPICPPPKFDVQFRWKQQEHKRNFSCRKRS